MKNSIKSIGFIYRLGVLLMLSLFIIFCTTTTVWAEEGYTISATSINEATQKSAGNMDLLTEEATASQTTQRSTPKRDVLIGNKHKDRLVGLAGHDTLRGKGGRDVLIGGWGNDKLYGGGGNDILVGGIGDDILSGGGGKDTLIGGGGLNRLTGNKGEDSFVFTRNDGGANHITDFKQGDKTIFKISTLSDMSFTVYRSPFGAMVVYGNTTIYFNDVDINTLFTLTDWYSWDFI